MALYADGVFPSFSITHDNMTGSSNNKSKLTNEKIEIFLRLIHLGNNITINITTITNNITINTVILLIILLTLTLVSDCQVERCPGYNLCCFWFVPISTISIFYQSHRLRHCLYNHLLTRLTGEYFYGKLSKDSPGSR